MVVIKAEIICDVCKKKLYYDSQTILAPTGREIRDWAQGKGWICGIQQDLCIECAEIKYRNLLLDIGY